VNDMGEPPYARIAAALRDQITGGALRPGDRVPSTREIIQLWGVAMATATKVLATLRQEGLVHPIPGVGTVVTAHARRTDNSPMATVQKKASSGQEPALARHGPPGRGADGQDPDHRTAGADPVLTQDRIVAAAIAVADTEGLAGVSMRRVATELGVAAMSLYRHVADKDTLVLQMIDAGFGELDLPTDPPAGWRERLEYAARTLWAMFRRHPWMAQAMSVTRPELLTSTMAAGEWMLAGLDGQGLDLATMLTAHITLFTYVRGAATHLELEADAEAASGLNADEFMDTRVDTMRSILAAGEFPVLGRVTENPYDFNLDTIFEFGLQRLLDGYAVLIGRAE
jgi:DNA-binding transcriptional regulator YhcF (GntR family)/AcrR family transcriptional regulator